VERDVEEIAKLSEESIIWYETTFNEKIELKMNAYLFDDEKSTDYHRLLNSVNLEIDIPAFAFIDGLFLFYNYYYYDPNFCIFTILHETVHLFQTHNYSLINNGIAEGHAYYVELKYYRFVNGYDYSDIEICKDITTTVFESIINNEDYPGNIFGYYHQDFQQWELHENILTREDNYRYDIGASFISYLVFNYGLDKLLKWFYKTTENNFKINFKNVYDLDFQDVENNWFLLLMSDLST